MRNKIIIIVLALIVVISSLYFYKKTDYITYNDQYISFSYPNVYGIKEINKSGIWSRRNIGQIENYDLYFGNISSLYSQIVIATSTLNSINDLNYPYEEWSIRDYRIENKNIGKLGAYDFLEETVIEDNKLSKWIHILANGKLYSFFAGTNELNSENLEIVNKLFNSYKNSVEIKSAF